MDFRRPHLIANALEGEPQEVREAVMSALDRLAVSPWSCGDPDAFKSKIRRGRFDQYIALLPGGWVLYYRICPAPPDAMERIHVDRFERDNLAEVTSDLWDPDDDQ